MQTLPTNGSLAPRSAAAQRSRFQIQALDRSSRVYPREVVRRALEINASAVVLAHNHPSGVAEPSRADDHLTQTLRAALQLIDVKVLDHLIVGRGVVVSLSERGML